MPLFNRMNRFASKDLLIAAKNKRIKELETENKQLKDELMKLRGMIYDKF